MSEEKTGTAQPTKSKKAKEGQAPVRSRHRIRENNVGNALRTVYQQTVEEDVPTEFLDLLGKLS